MARENLTAEVKCRVAPALRAQLEVLADGRELGLSDVVREALRDHVRRIEAPADVKMAGVSVADKMEGARSA